MSHPKTLSTRSGRRTFIPVRPLQSRCDYRWHWCRWKRRDRTSGQCHFNADKATEEPNLAPHWSWLPVHSPGQTYLSTTPRRPHHPRSALYVIFMTVRADVTERDEMDSYKHSCLLTGSHLPVFTPAHWPKRATLNATRIDAEPDCETKVAEHQSQLCCIFWFLVVTSPDYEEP